MRPLERCFALSALLLFSIALPCQTNPVAVCVAVDGKDQSPDTAGTLASALTRQVPRKARSLLGIAVPPASKTKVMLEAQNRGCEYLVRLQWIHQDTVELPSPSAPALPGLGTPVSQSGTVQPFSSEAFFARPFVTGSEVLSYAIARVGSKRAFSAGAILPPLFGTNYSERLARVVMKKIVR